MNNLFEIDFCSVFHISLTSFTKQWTQRFIKSMTWMQKGKATDNNKFHSFNRIIRSSGPIVIDRGWSKNPCNILKNRIMGHTFNRKTCVDQIKLACNNLSTNLWDQQFKSISKFIYDDLISQWKPPIFISKSPSMIISSFYYFKFFKLFFKILQYWNSFNVILIIFIQLKWLIDT